MIGLLSDSHGDLDAFDAAYRLLRSKGAERFFFLGGRYADLEAWVTWRKQRSRGSREYSDADFLADIASFLGSQERAAIPKEAAPKEAAPKDAFTDPSAGAEEEDAVQLRGRFVQTPERESLQYLDANVPRKLLEMVGDQLCCVVHHKNDLSRDDLMNATLFVHGASPEPKVVQIGPRFFATPGRLAGAAEQTCALVETGGKFPRFTAWRLDGKVVVNREPLGVERHTRLPGVKLTVK